MGESWLATCGASPSSVSRFICEMGTFSHHRPIGYKQRPLES